MSAHFYVYEHWRPDTNQCFYVGKGQKFRSGSLRGRNPHHRNIVAKVEMLGLKVEVRIISGNMTEDAAFDLERERISHWRESGHKLANRTSGGEGMSNPPPEVRAAISKALTGNKHSLGVKRTESQCEAIGARMRGNKFWLGKTITEEHRANLSKALKGRPGRRKSAEEIAKIKATLGAKEWSIESLQKTVERFESYRELGPRSLAKPVICVDDQKVFASASAAARHYGVSPSALTELCLEKKYRKTVGGLVFKYISKEAA